MEMYSIIFNEETTVCWNKNLEMSRFFIESHQNHANDLLKAQGHLFLNEIHDMLGVKRTSVGATSGWLWDGEGCSNYVDFKLMINTENGSIIIDLNPDGIIYDKI